MTLTNGAGLTLTQPGWRFGYNELTDLDSTPVAVETGLGELTLDLADGVVALSGSGTLGLGSLGSLSGNYVISTDGTALTLTVSGGSASLAVGGRTLSLTGVAGSVTISGSTFTFGGLSGSGALDLGTLGSVTGTFAVANVSGGLSLTASALSAQLSAGTRRGHALGWRRHGDDGLGRSDHDRADRGARAQRSPGTGRSSGTPILTFSTTTSAFSLAGTGALRLAGLLDLVGTLTIEADDSGESRTITVALSGTGASGSVTIAADGTFSGTASGAVTLPLAVPGVTLSGSGALSFSNGTWAVAMSAAVLTTPVGTLSGR